MMTNANKKLPLADIINILLLHFQIIGVMAVAMAYFPDVAFNVDHGFKFLLKNKDDVLFSGRYLKN